MTVNHVPPHDLGSEQSILGAILLRNEALDVVADLAPDDFYDPKNRAVFEACVELRALARAVDPVTLEERLRAAGTWEAVGRDSYLSDLVSSCATADNVSFYADIVRDKATARRVIFAASEIATRGFADYGTVEEYLSEAWSALSAVTRRQPDSTKPIGEWVKLVFDEFANALARKEQHGGEVVAGIPTGFADLDMLIGGFELGQITVVAARPRTGKSALCRSFADNISATGTGVHVISLEDPGKIYARRVLADRARLDLRKLRTLEGIGRAEFADFTMAANEVRSTPPRRWLLDDARGLSSAQIAARVRKHARENQTRVVVVDYVQLINETSVRRNADPRERMDAAVTGLDRLAGEGYHVILVAQLNRESEKRAGGRPILSELKETGKLEESSRVVILPWRPELYEQNRTKKLDMAGKAYLIVAKQSNGPEGDIEVFFDAPTATFRPLSRRQLDPIAERYA